MVRTFAAAAGFAMLLGLAGCVAPRGPVFGDWHGRQPGGDPLNTSYVDVVLYGAPGDRSGAYDFQAVMTDATLDSAGDHTLTWGDRWTLGPGSVPGGPPVLELHDLPAGEISRYALMANGLLVPLTRAGLPDLSHYSLLYALVPVPRQSRAYGRI